MTEPFKQKPFKCIHGHVVYVLEAHWAEQLFCREPEMHFGKETWCGAPIYEVIEMPED